MQKIKNKSGLALGAIFALVVSMFVGVTPAQATESSIVLTPRGAGAASLNQMLHGETFELSFRYGTGVTGVNGSQGTRSNTEMKLHYSITSESNNVTFRDDADGDFSGGSTAIAGTSISASVSNPTGPATGYLAIDSGSPYIDIAIAAGTSISSAVSITLTPFLDIDLVTGYSAGDAIGTAYTVTFVPWSTLGTALTLNAPSVGDGSVTASVAVTAGSIRWSQLDGYFGVHIDSTGDTSTGNTGTISAVSPFASTEERAATTIDDTNVNYSFSAAVNVSPLTNVGGVNSVSAYVLYMPAVTSANTDNIVAGEVVATKTVAVASAAATGLTVSAVTSANIIKTGDAAASARPNSAFTLNAFPYSASTTTSIAAASAFTVSAVGSGIDFDADSGVVVNGTVYTSSAAFLAAGFTQPAGTTTVAVSTFGQDAAGTDTMQFTLESGLISTTLTVTLNAAAYTAVYVPTAVAGLAGASKTFVVSVQDQFGEKPVRTDLRMHASLNLASSVSTTAAAVTAGVATVTLAPLPATRTGSATLTLQIQNFNQATQNWDNIGTTDTVTWNVYSYTAGTDAFTSRTLTSSASISYGVAAYSWSGVISVGIANSFSDITVTAPGMVIENNDETSVTASDTLTVAANAKTGNFRFASKKAGTYTVSFAVGTATTTSTIVIDAAGHDKGSTITFDVASIASGQTSTITGTLVDANGNPVATRGTASVAVTYTGKGLPYGNSSTMQTDADGEFTFQVLVLSTEKGDAAVSATYKPTGSASYTGNVTVVKAISVGAASAASADQKVNAGSFKGYVALYAKGYAGQRMSAKVGNDWVVVESLASDFERVVEYTGAGYTIAVRIYIDRVLVDTITVVTK